MNNGVQAFTEQTNSPSLCTNNRLENPPVAAVFVRRNNPPTFFFHSYPFCYSRLLILFALTNRKQASRVAACFPRGFEPLSGPQSQTKYPPIAFPHPTQRTLYQASPRDPHALGYPRPSKLIRGGGSEVGVQPSWPTLIYLI